MNQRRRSGRPGSPSQQTRHQIDLVFVGDRHQKVVRANVFVLQELGVGAIPVDHRDPRQIPSELLRLLGVALDQEDRRTRFTQQTRQRRADDASAHDADAVCLLVVAEEVFGLDHLPWLTDQIDAVLG